MYNIPAKHPNKTGSGTQRGTTQDGRICHKQSVLQLTRVSQATSPTTRSQFHRQPVLQSRFYEIPWDLTGFHKVPQEPVGFTIN